MEITLGHTYRWHATTKRCTLSTFAKPSTIHTNIYFLLLHLKLIR